MSDECSLDVLGLNVSFRSGANMERARKAAAYVENRFEALRATSSQGKDILLTYLVLELADDLLQMKSRQAGALQRVERLTVKIEDALGQPWGACDDSLGANLTKNNL